MATTAVSAGQIMDRVANLLNDPAKTDYTYTVQIPYLNTAIDELSENLEDAQVNTANLTAVIIVVPANMPAILSVDDGGFGLPPGFPFPTVPRFPGDLVEIQELRERDVGSTQPFSLMTREEYAPYRVPTDKLLYWAWEDQRIKFNTIGPYDRPMGATTDREVQIRYLRQAVGYIVDENSMIFMINSRSYLSYKTAALCAMFIGENESRAAILNDQAEKALERTISISNKGRQQIMTRHRPFRAGWKTRGGY